MASTRKPGVSELGRSQTKLERTEAGRRQRREEIQGGDIGGRVEDCTEEQGSGGIAWPRAALRGTPDSNLQPLGSSRMAGSYLHHPPFQPAGAWTRVRACAEDVWQCSPHSTVRVAESESPTAERNKITYKSPAG